MDKHEALKRLDALESEAAALRKIIDAPEIAPSLLTKPEPGSGQPYYAIDGTAVQGTVVSGTYNACSSNPEAYRHGNIFTDRATAEAYAESIDTMLLLRHQPGTVPAVNDIEQFVIAPESYGTAPRVDSWRDIDTKAARLSPCFATREHAQAALDAIGADRIERMWKTLHHIED